MAEILKVTSPITIKDRVNNIPKQMPDSIFDLGGTENAVKGIQKTLTDQSGKTSQEETALNLAKEILQPLNEPTTVQSDNMKALMAMFKLMASSEAGASPKVTAQFLEKLFVNPEQLQEALITRDKGETPFKGEAFDILRMLSEALGAGKRTAGTTQGDLKGMNANAQNTTGKGAAEAQGSLANQAMRNTPTRIQESIANILRHFDGLVNQENSLNAIVQQSKGLAKHLFNADKQILEHHVDHLETMMNTSRHTGKSAVAGNIETAKLSSEMAKEAVEAQRIAGDSLAELNSRDNKEVRQFLKNEFIPMLSSLVSRYQQNDNIRNPVMTIIHYIVRFDKGEPKLLNQAVEQLAQELKPATSLTDEDFNEMKKLIIDAARDFKTEETQQDAEKKFMAKFGIAPEEHDMASLLGKSLQEGTPQKMQALAMNLLHSLVSSESPVMPLMHFMVPVKFQGEDTFVEFFIDKNAEERKGEAQDAKTIFFTIQSEKFGTFEVDLLARDMMIDLDIKCPGMLMEGVKNVKTSIRDEMTQHGYRLAGYQVSNFVEEMPIIRRFPKLAERKVGMDVKV